MTGDPPDQPSAQAGRPNAHLQRALAENAQRMERATKIESDRPDHRRFVLTEDINQRLDRYLCKQLPGLSRSRLQKLINEGAVKVNDHTPKASTKLHAGDVVDLLVPPPEIKQIPAEPIPVDVLYEDDHLIVINKQMDLVVHPARSNLHGTLVNALAWYFKDTAANGLDALSRVGLDEFRPGIVHRLDRDTTGCMVVAKTDTAHMRLNRMFENRKVQKYYLAVVHGSMRESGGVIDQPIGKHPSVKEAYAVTHGPTARHAVTLYRVRELYDDFTLVELELKTGRTHQIRVHLGYLGHPIVSDIIYGGEPMGWPEVKSPPTPAGGQPYLTFARDKPEGVRIWDRMARRDDLLIFRPALHAAVLQFVHPMTDQPMKFTAPLHADMADLIQTLRQHRPGAGVQQVDGAQVDMDALG